MRLPYLQVTQETWDYARSLAALTECSVGVGFMLVCDLWRWGITLGPEDQPPTGICDSPRAARLLCAAVGWTGPSEILITALADLGLIEVLPTGLRVRGMGRYAGAWHDSAERTKSRREKATKAANARWGGQKMLEGGQNDARSMLGDARALLEGGKTQTQTQTHREALKTLSTSSTPPPPEESDFSDCVTDPGIHLAQYPKPKERSTDTLPEAASGRAPTGVSGADQAVEGAHVTSAHSSLGHEVFTHWQQAMDKPRALYDDKRRARVEARLEEGYSVAELCLAVDGCAGDPWSRGKNDRGKPFLDLELICRDAVRVDRFLEIARGLEPPEPELTCIACGRHEHVADRWGLQLCDACNGAAVDAQPIQCTDMPARVAAWVAAREVAA